MGMSWGRVFVWARVVGRAFVLGEWVDLGEHVFSVAILAQVTCGLPGCRRRESQRPLIS